MIPVDPVVQAALESDSVRLVLFLELALDGDVFVRYCTAGADLQWEPPSADEPVTWNGMGAVLGVDPIIEAGSLEVLAWDVTLSGVPSDLLALAALEEVVNRDATAWIGVYTEAGALVGAPFVKFRGQINAMPIDDDPKDSKVILRLESRLIWLLRPSNAYWTNADQKARFPDDDGLKFAEITAARTLRYGPAV